MNENKYGVDFFLLNNIQCVKHCVSAMHGIFMFLTLNIQFILGVYCIRWALKRMRFASHQRNVKVLQRSQ